MIKILPIEKQKPHFVVTIHYMIGDGDGDTEEVLSYETEEELEEVIPYIKILRKLKPLKNHWGICFSNYPSEYPGEYIGLSEAEYAMFLQILSYNDTPSKFFTDSLYSERETYFVVFQGIEVTYIDENSSKHEVLID